MSPLQQALQFELAGEPRSDLRNKLSEWHLEVLPFSCILFSSYSFFNVFLIKKYLQHIFVQNHLWAPARLHEKKNCNLLAYNDC